MEEYQWYEDLLFYGVKGERHEDTDFQLIPLIVEKVIIPKLTSEKLRSFSSLTFLPSRLGMIENLYDPLSAQQTRNLVKSVENLFQTYPTMTDDSKTVQVLFTRFLQAYNSFLLRLYSKLLSIVCNVHLTMISTFHCIQKKSSQLVRPSRRQINQLFSQRSFSFVNIGAVSNS